jgi:hypothetical protein
VTVGAAITSTPPRRIAAAGLIAICALTLAACGSSKSLATQANAICAAANKQVRALPKSPNTLQGLASSAQRELPIGQAEIAKLAALTAPAGERARFGGAISDLREEAHAVREVIADVHAGKTHAITVIGAQLAPVERDLDTKAAALDIGQCTKNVSPQG